MLLDGAAHLDVLDVLSQPAVQARQSRLCLCAGQRLCGRGLLWRDGCGQLSKSGGADHFGQACEGLHAYKAALVLCWRMQQGTSGSGDLGNIWGFWRAWILQDIAEGIGCWVKLCAGGHSIGYWVALCAGGHSRGYRVLADLMRWRS